MRTPAAERQRKHYAKKKAEWASLPPIPCACGCGTMIPPINCQGKPAHYRLGHGPRPAGFMTGQPAWNKGRSNPRAWGKKMATEVVARRVATRRAKNGGVYSPRAGGWKHSEETRARMRETNRRGGLFGPHNPFYGKTHTDEIRARLSQPGPLNPQWRGGVATLPYGPDFTRKFKRLIRERDRQTCQRCGITHEAFGKTLDIHHIDHNKMNNNPTNLVTLCHPCNMWYNQLTGEPFRWPSE